MEWEPRRKEENMRITNKMMTNNMLYNINRNRANLNILESQYSSGKKIQRPSEDPIVAVRSLKLRTNLTELNQYYEKNIPDAKSWMNVTESALDTVNGLFTPMHGYFLQGANDTLSKSDRQSVLANLEQLATQLYHEGNTDYAGRYVFTGYKTDTSLLFEGDTNNLDYTITENFTSLDIENITKVKEATDFDSYDLAALSPEDIDKAPDLIEGHRIRLSYKDLKGEEGADGQPVIGIEIRKGDTTETFDNIVTMSMNDPEAYQPEAGAINYIPETGELILGEDVFNNLRQADDINITYKKDTFNKDELRPEHYFDCIKVDNNDPELREINYIQKDQQIQYEINFNQKLTINSQAKKAYSHDIIRGIEDLRLAAEDVSKTERRIKEVEKYIEDPTITDKAGLERLLETLNGELSLKNKVLQERFSKGMTTITEQEELVNIEVADLGSRYVRLELTESRLETQQVDFMDLLSNNEDVDLVDTIIKYGSAETIYNASLAAASQIVKSTLLDFL